MRATRGLVQGLWWLWWCCMLVVGDKLQFVTLSLVPCVTLRIQGSLMLVSTHGYFTGGFLVECQYYPELRD